ncbi:MAG TPA: tetratricopeptide repeat protein, partial [Chthoniobacteraceae bacterium]|nr:tetratricopeptide repeat protein [Chthoniobacteraceae bacterium]
MTFSRICGVALLALTSAHLSMRAQEAPPLKPFRLDDDKPIPRAQPVPRPVPIPASPAATPVPVATPVPIQRATPVTEKPKPPGRNAPAGDAPASTAPMADPAGEITLKPGVRLTPDQIQLSIADRFYAQKMYDAAAPEYEKYLGLYPTAPDRPAALFRLGESYRQNGAVNAAKSSFETLLNQFTNGDFIGPAAYRLAEMLYAERNFNAALPLYRRASVRLKDPKLANSAKFFTARCLEGLGQKSEARGLYEELAIASQDNPFADASRLSYSLLLKETGRTSEALKQVQALARDAQNPELKAQATVYSGLWEIELNHPAKAAEELKKALEMPAIGKWKEVAQVGLIQMLFNSEKYEQVIETFVNNEKEFGPETRPQLLLLAAKAYRQLKKYPEALRTFDLIVSEYAASAPAKEAAFERLTTLYVSGGDELIPEIDKTLATTPEGSRRDQILLMKAESLFKKADYGAAAPLYASLSDSKLLSGTLRSEALYKAGLCQLETGDAAAAVKSFTALRDSYPTFKSLPAAICRSALARMRLNDMSGALKDFNYIIDKYPKTKERELSLYQKAKILGKQGDNKEMAATFKILLRDYPKTAERADANYWIGWVAFENRDYKAAVEPLAKARELNKEEFFERASLRIMLSHFYSENREAVGREIETYGNGGGKGQVPYEVLAWLGHSYHDLAKNAAKADARVDTYIEKLQQSGKWLGMLCARDDAKPEDYWALGDTFLMLQQYDKAALPLQKYLEITKDAPARAEGLLALATAEIGLRRFDDGKKSVEEAIRLQPDGPINAEARIVMGDLLMAEERFEDAAKMYEGVSLVIDDETITPRALEKSINAYRKASKDAEANKLLNTLQSRYPEYY